MCHLYINRAGIVGIFHCAVPAVVWFAYVLFTVPFREIYLLRLGLCLFIGCPIGAYLNRHSVDMWLAKHRGDSGPAKIIDGTINGAAVGIGTALLPALTALISTNHPEMAKTFIKTLMISFMLIPFFGYTSLVSLSNADIKISLREPKRVAYTRVKTAPNKNSCAKSFKDIKNTANVPAASNAEVTLLLAR